MRSFVHNLRKRKHNPKRGIGTTVGAHNLDLLSRRVVYVGSPFHKRNPGDFQLTPPSQPRPNKTLCDGVRIFQRDLAQVLLEKGIRFGLLSSQRRGEFPQNIWAVSPSGVALEAQLDNAERGTYHGYPMLHGDPLAEEVVKRWKEQQSRE
jgi:hypothetical protein